jgi:hypothetical protein
MLLSTKHSNIQLVYTSLWYNGHDEHRDYKNTYTTMITIDHILVSSFRFIYLGYMRSLSTPLTLGNRETVGMLYTCPRR